MILLRGEALLILIVKNTAYNRTQMERSCNSRRAADSLIDESKLIFSACQGLSGLFSRLY